LTPTIFTLTHNDWQELCEDETNNILYYALIYAALGWYVFPAPPNEKKSYKCAEHSNGRQWGMTRDADEITKDWARWNDANIGIPCGTVNAIFVVEIDTPQGHNVDGFASLVELETKYGQLPQTLTAESPTGSQHYYFNYPTDGTIIKPTASKFASGIDVRGEGGMVIAPPSIKRGKGVYRWKSLVPIADAPPWLIELAKDAPRPDYIPRPPHYDDITQDEKKAKIEKALEIVGGLGLGAYDKTDVRNKWLAIVAGICNDLGDDGYWLARDWSKKYGGCDWEKKYSKTFQEQWDSIKRNPKAPIGYLFKLAKEIDPHWYRDWLNDRPETARRHYDDLDYGVGSNKG
jgi:Bifunctional DNA primase/polymerase, N-terminal